MFQERRISRTSSGGIQTMWLISSTGGSMTRFAIITREFAFEASHSLPGHRGKCRRPHGHSYRLEISLRGPILHAPGESDDGMVMDFEDLKTMVNATILETLSDSVSRGSATGLIETGGLDHNDLNVLTGIRTTAENLVHWIWDALVGAGLPEDLLYRIRLWETEKGSVEITRAERGGVSR
jgi:6-pyruvoyltetrahydropterin/6-carboxytetrahydropterin synthase